MRPRWRSKGSWFGVTHSRRLGASPSVGNCHDHPWWRRSVNRKQEKHGCTLFADNQSHVRIGEKALALLAELSEVITLEFA